MVYQHSYKHKIEHIYNPKERKNIHIWREYQTFL